MAGAKAVSDWCGYLLDLPTRKLRQMERNGELKLRGEGIEVELDESHWFKVKYHVGKGKTRVGWNFCMVERGTGRFITVFVSRRNRSTLEPIIHGAELLKTQLITGLNRSAVFDEDEAVKDVPYCPHLREAMSLRWRPRGL